MLSLVSKIKIGYEKPVFVRHRQEILLKVSHTIFVTHSGWRLVKTRVHDISIYK